MKTSLFLLLAAMCLGVLFFTNGCVHDGTCSNVPQRPTPTPAPSPGAATPSPNASLADDHFSQKSLDDADDSGPQIQVFKASGEKQCSQSSGAPIQDMSKQLTHHKISVIESHSQPDGLMHMALCGSPTGKIHVFTILRKHLKQAQKLGFKVLTLHE